MEGKTTSSFFFIKVLLYFHIAEAKWDWIPCNYNLKREIHGKTTFWNLSPSIILTNPTGSVIQEI